MSVRLFAFSGLAVFLILMFTAATQSCELPIGVPESRRLGLFDTSSPTPQSFVLTRSFALQQLALVSPARIGRFPPLPEGLPPRLRVRVLLGSSVLLDQELTPTSYQVANWHEPHPSALLQLKTSLDDLLRFGVSYTLELTALQAAPAASPFHVFLEYLNERQYDETVRTERLGDTGVRAHG
jgi:hypothetical protein